MAAQTLTDEAYAKKDVNGEVKYGEDVTQAAVADLAEVTPGNIESVTIAGAKVTGVTYTKKGKTCTYTTEAGKEKYSVN